MRTSTKNVLVQGFVAGLIGWAVVALFFFIANLVAGRPPFYTVAVLGGTVFYGWTEAADIVIWAGPVLAYNGLQLLIFLAIGVLAAWIAANAERGPQFWYLGVSIFLFAVLHFIGAVTWLGELVRAVVPVGSIAAASLLAATAMAAYLWWAHPRLRRVFHEYEDQPE